MVRTNMMLAAVLLMLAAGGAAWLRLAPAASSTPGAESTRVLDAATVPMIEAFELMAGGETTRLERSSGAGWTLVPADGVRWPIRTESLQGFLGLLTRARGRVMEDAPETDPSRTLRLITDDAWTEIAFAGGSTGGLAPARLTRPGEPPIWVLLDADVASVVRSGFEAWRRASMAPAPPGRVVGVSLEAADRVVRLERDDVAWRLASASDLPATSGSVDAVLSALGGGEVIAWDAPAPTEDDVPIATIELRWARASESSGAGWLQRIDVHGVGDAEGASLIVTSSLDDGEGAVWGPMTLRVDSAALAPISTAPEAYLPRRPIGRPSASVIRARITTPDESASVALSLIAGRWRASPDRDWEIDPDAWARALEVLASPAAAGVALSQPEGVGEPVARVEIPTQGDAPALRLNVATAIDDPSTLVVESGGIWFIYASGVLDPAGWAPTAN